MPTGLGFSGGSPSEPSFARVDDWRHASSTANSMQTSYHTAPSSTARPTQQDSTAANDVRRIRIRWDRLDHPINLRLQDSGRAMVAQLRQKFHRRQLDQALFQLVLATNRDANVDADEVIVVLADELVDKDWENAVAWLRDLSGADIFGRIEPLNPDD